MVGRTLDILVEGQEQGLSVGRSYRDAPEIDGLVLVQAALPVGQIVPVRVTAALEYDLIAEPARGRAGGQACAMAAEAAAVAVGQSAAQPRAVL